ncbi:MAG: hypothetical protein ACR2GY_10055 [Phycisphaerales bacterium]
MDEQSSQRIQRVFQWSPAAAWLLVVVTGTACLCGCQKSLFPRDTPRTQFEAHDRLRNRFIPDRIPDEFGQMRPALRQRLSPRGT